MLFKSKNSYFCWLSLLHWYEWENRKSDNSQFPIILMVVMTFSTSCFFCITVWRASKEHSNSFETKSNLNGSPLTSKATSGYFGQSVWNWIKGNVPSPFPLKKADLTGTIKASPNLPAGAGKFPPVTCGNRWQSLPAEIFACIRRYFYLQISWPAAFAGIFARTSFTVWLLS